MTARTTTGLGREALALGLDTLDLARIHGEAMASIEPATGNPVDAGTASARAREFFADVAAPIEGTHRVALEAQGLVAQSARELRDARRELVLAQRALKKEREHRAAAERSLAESEAVARGLLAASHRMQNQLRHLARQTLSAQEEERKEISRELHDEVAQTLTAINVHLAALTREAILNSTGIKRKILRTQHLVEKSVGVVHKFARDLRPTMLDNLGLIPALHSYMKEFTSRTKIPIRLTAYAGVERLSIAKRTVLYRVAQEALTNVDRHAQATRVNVTIERLPGAIRMEIRDNGVSFDTESLASARKPKGLGLIGMRERVEMVGGELTITAKPGKGTTIAARIPSKSVAPQ